MRKGLVALYFFTPLARVERRMSALLLSRGV
jgi:hypothetical protein